MKQIEKTIVIFILFTLLCVFPEVRALDNKNETNNYDSYSSSESQKENKTKCKYKEGEVIITYEQTFWNSTAKLTLDSVFNSYKIDETSKFEDIEIDSDKTISIATSESKSTSLAISLVKSDKHTTEELIDIFKDKDWIISVEPNYIIESKSLTNDTYERYQWALENTGQNSGTNELDINPISTSSDNEKVIAIIDTGVDYTHEDLKNVMWTNPYSKSELKGVHGYDFVNDDNDPYDDNYHGTHVAGIIAAEPNNNNGISGALLTADNIKIMALKVFDNQGQSNDLYTIIEAYNYIYKAQQLGTRVVAINNSWGFFGSVENEEEKLFMNSLVSVINLVGEKGALSICAAGNENMNLGEDGLVDIETLKVDENGDAILDEFGNTISEYVLCKSIPGCLDSDYIISVAASSEKDELASFSNYGEAIDIAAPGTNILSTIPKLTLYYFTDEMIDNGRYLPSIYDETKRDKVCEQFWDFENCSIEDIPFTVNVGTLSIAEDKSFGTGKKCLKWEFTLDSNEISPKLKLGNNFENNDFFSCMITAETKDVSWKPTEGKEVEEWPGVAPFIVAGPIETSEDGTESITDLGSATFEAKSNYWEKFGNTVWDLANGPIYEGKLNMNDLYIKLLNPKPSKFTIFIDDFAVSKPCNEEAVRVPYSFLNGTSMATPFVTAAVGTLSNIYENDTALQLKDKLLLCTRKSENLNEKVATGGVLDLSKVITHATGVTLDKTSAELTVGDTLILTPTVIPDNATNKNVIWTSSNEKIATVENGKVTALNEGTTTIIAISEDGEFEAKCEIYVNKVLLDGLKISFDGYSESIKDNHKYLYNISPNTTIKEIIKNIDTNGKITVYSDNKELTEDNVKVTTGMKTIISLNNEHSEFIIVVKGDTNGDGEANLKDLLQINKHRLNKMILVEEYLLAGDVNKDNKVDLKDLLQINKFRLGKINTL